MRTDANSNYKKSFLIHKLLRVILLFGCRQEFFSILETPTSFPTHINFVFIHFKRRLNNYTDPDTSAPVVEITLNPTFRILLDIIPDFKQITNSQLLSCSDTRSLQPVKPNHMLGVSLSIPST